MRLLDLIVLVGYLAGVLAVGLWFGRRRATADGYMAAGRQIPGWAVGLSIFGAYVSSISFVALPGKAFAEDWSGFLFSLSIVPAAWLAARFFVPFYRRAGQLSCYEHLEERFGPWARVYGVGCYLLTQAFRGGAILYLLALALGPMTGLDLPTLILLAGCAVVAYTAVGGLEAVIWTEVVQSVVFAVGATACVVVLLAGMPEGPGQLFRVAAERGKWSLGSWEPSLTGRTAWVVLLYGLTINLRNFGCDQSYVQRFHAARSERDARRSVWVGALGYIPMSAVFFFIGTGLFAFYAANPDRGIDPDAVIAAKQGDRVFPRFMVTELPPGLAGLVVAAVFAAAQSSVAAAVAGSSTLLFCDVYKRYIRPDADDRAAVRMLRLSAVGFGLASTAAAVLMWRLNVEQSALDAWWRLEGVGKGGVLGLFLLGQLLTRTNHPAAALATAIAVGVLAWVAFFPASGNEPSPWRSPFDPLLAATLGTVLIVLLGGLLTILFGPTRPPARPEKVKCDSPA